MRWTRDKYVALMTFDDVPRPMFSELFGPLIGLEDEWCEQGAAEHKGSRFETGHSHPSLSVRPPRDRRGTRSRATSILPTNVRFAVAGCQCRPRPQALKSFRTSSSLTWSKSR